MNTIQKIIWSVYSIIMGLVIFLSIEESEFSLVIITTTIATPVTVYLSYLWKKTK